MIIASIVIGVIILVGMAVAVGISFRSSLSTRYRVSAVCFLVSAGLMCVRLGMDIYLGLSWTKSAAFVAMFVIFSGLVVFAGKKKIQQQSNNEH